MATSPCANCAAVHEGPCRSPLKRFRSRDEIAAPLKRAPSGPKLCELCQQPASDLCICSFPPSQLCSNCIQAHRSQTPEDTHNLFPVAEDEKINDEQECLYARMRCIVNSAAVKQVSRSLPDLNALEKEVITAYDAIITQIERLKERQLTNLRDIHRSLRARVAMASLTTRVNILNRAYEPQNGIEEVIWTSTDDTDPSAYRLFSLNVVHNYPIETLQDPVKIDLKIFPTNVPIHIAQIGIEPEPENHGFLAVDNVPVSGDDSQSLMPKLKQYKTNLICFSAFERTQQIVEEEMELHMVEDGKKMALDRAKLLFEKFCGEKIGKPPQEFVSKLLKWTERTFARYSTVARLSKLQHEQSEKLGASLGSKCNYCEKYSHQSVRCKCGKVTTTQMTYCGLECLGKDEPFHACP